MPHLEERLREIGLPPSHADDPGLLAADLRALWLGDAREVARRLLALAIERHPAHADLRELGAGIALADGDPDAGYEQVVEALVLGGADGPRLALLAQCLVRGGQEDAGVLAATRAAEYEAIPEWLRAQGATIERALRAKAVVRESLEREERSGPEAALEWIDAHHEDLALRTFGLRRRRGLLLARLGRWSDAFDALAWLTLCAHDDPALLLSSAEVFLREGGAALGLNAIRSARRFAVPEPETSLLEAEIHDALGDHGAVVTTLGPLLDLYPGDARIGMRLALAWMSLGAAAEASAISRRLVERHPESRRCWSMHAEVLDALGDRAGAEAARGRAAALP